MQSDTKHIILSSKPLKMVTEQDEISLNHTEDKLESNSAEEFFCEY